MTTSLLSGLIIIAAGVVLIHLGIGVKEPGARVRFCDLPKGARFKYPDDDRIWVVLESHGIGLIAEWHGVHYRGRQSHCCFVDDEWSLESEVEAVE